MSIKSSIISALRTIFSGPAIHTTAQISYLRPNNILKGKKIVIIGGSRGIGAAMAEKFVNEGADVLIAGRTEKTIKDTAERIGCKYLTLDICKVELFPKFINRADELLGGANCLVNNAGISLHENTFFDVTPD